jgi:glycosidase
MDGPALYEVNTRYLLQELGAALGRRATLDDVPDGFLDEWARLGFGWVWLMGVWQTGPAGLEVSRSDPVLRAGYAAELPDWREEDVCGSPFAVRSYTVDSLYGGDGALSRLRGRLAARGIRLVLDFVVNHVALDHPWVSSHPEYFIHGSEVDLAREPHNYARVQADRNPLILANGRDPYFPGWADTLQLNFRSAGCREAQVAELLRIADRCDGVRCDMAMLVQPEVFLQTWGDRSRPADGSAPVDVPFWRDAIRAARMERVDFLFIAEVYWDMEWQLQQEGFDYSYDKRLYDRLKAGRARPVREHLMADIAFQVHSLRFLENHDEQRAATAFSPDMLRAAAVIGFFVPGMRFFHEGQTEGRRVHASMHLCRRPYEPPAQNLVAFYVSILGCLKRPEVHSGTWRLWPCRPAWDGNGTWDQFVVFSWEAGDDQRLLVVVNYGPSQGQCYVTLDMPELAGRQYQLRDLMSEACYEREGNELAGNGLYLDLPAWGYHIFDLTASD